MIDFLYFSRPFLPFPFSGTKRWSTNTVTQQGAKFYNPASVLTTLSQQMYRGKWFTNPKEACLVPGCAFGGASVATGGGNFLRNIKWNMPATENNHFFHSFFNEIQQNSQLLQETIVAYQNHEYVFFSVFFCSPSDTLFFDNIIFLTCFS